MSRINNQFSVAVHIMTVLGDHYGEQVTSAHLTTSVRAHESQVRSVLSKLVKSGLVVASRGRNGFSSLSRPANKISLLQIYKAVGAPRVFSIHDYPKEKTCPRAALTKRQCRTFWRTRSERLRPGWAGECFLRWSQKPGITSRFLGPQCHSGRDIGKENIALIPIP